MAPEREVLRKMNLGISMTSSDHFRAVYVHRVPIEISGMIQTDHYNTMSDTF